MAYSAHKPYPLFFVSASIMLSLHPIIAGWSSPVAREAHNLEVTGSNPVPAIRPVLVTGAIPEEPAVTRVVSAGSVVSCGAVLPDADACGVAFRVSMDAQFTSHSVGLPCPPSAPTPGLESSVPTTSSKWWSRDITCGPD